MEQRRRRLWSIAIERSIFYFPVEAIGINIITVDDARKDHPGQHGELELWTLGVFLPVGGFNLLRCSRQHEVFQITIEQMGKVRGKPAAQCGARTRLAAVRKPRVMARNALRHEPSKCLILLASDLRAQCRVVHAGTTDALLVSVGVLAEVVELSRGFCKPCRAEVSCRLTCKFNNGVEVIRKCLPAAFVRIGR